MNGHTLQEYMQEARGYALQRASATQASIRGEESEQVELRDPSPGNAMKNMRSEPPGGMREALLIVASFLFFYLPDYPQRLFHGWWPRCCC
ncbi:IgaA/UmoB family intracellular growth attenuator [Acinetobacter baumannii]|uniref:IgaA/UmoB family intracellular growth attenuator n=1 Tax=Acinetobacter baumannii TaxID=470 RepID=UPI003D300C7F